MEVLPSLLPDYGKIKSLGHRDLADLFHGRIVIEEKVDGSPCESSVKLEWPHSVIDPNPTPSLAWMLFYIGTVCKGLDVLMSEIAVHHGASELNPNVLWLASHVGLLAAYLIGMLLIVGTAWLLAIRWRVFPRLLTGVYALALAVTVGIDLSQLQMVLR